MISTQLPFVIVPVFIIIIYFFIMSSLRRKRIIFHQLSTFLNGRITASFFKPGFKGQHEGFPYEIEHMMGGENTPEYLRIFFERPTPFKMTAIPRGKSFLADLASKQWFSDEVKTGNHEFDDRIVVYSNDVWPVSNYLTTTGVQENISALFLLDYEELQIAKNRVQVEKPSEGVKGLAIDLEMTRLTETIRRLAFLAKILTSPRAGV
ncbi:MAG: hypothetical protein WC405_06395 [Syntrophales bacterium]